MKIMYTTLLPENPIQHEYENIDFFIKSSEFYNINNLFEFRFFSAHNNPLEYLKNKYGLKHTYGRIDFEYNEKMNERRGHEIGFCKSEIFKHCIDLVDFYDYLFFIDSDIRIDSKDAYELCKSIEFCENIFINIPYALRDLKIVSPASFGCYIIPSYILKQNKNIGDNIYLVDIKDGELIRKGEPDCTIRNNLILSKCNELRALSVNTRHYLDNKHYVEYDEGKIKIFN